MVNGVAQVNIFGSQKYAVRIDVDPRQLAGRGLGIDEVASSIENANVNMPTGAIFGDRTFVVTTNGQLMQASAYGPTIIAYRNGYPFGSTKWLASTTAWRTTARQAGRSASRCIISRSEAAGHERRADRRRDQGAAARHPRAASGLGVAGYPQRPFGNHPRVGERRQADAARSRWRSVILVIFIFLRNISATVIPSLALPGSLVGTFAVMYVLGYSLDNLSLMALTCRRLRRDDAIVMLENIVRHMEMGKPPMQAALDGSKEIASRSCR
jgi:HAE1 family hydrophobic/amphiphilic exporter-1